MASDTKDEAVRSKEDRDRAASERATRAHRSRTGEDIAPYEGEDAELIADSGYSHVDQMNDGGYWETALEESEELVRSGGGDAEPEARKASAKRALEMQRTGPTDPDEQPEELK